LVKQPFLCIQELEMLTNEQIAQQAHDSTRHPSNGPFASITNLSFKRELIQEVVNYEEGRGDPRPLPYPIEVARLVRERQDEARLASGVVTPHTSALAAEKLKAGEEVHPAFLPVEPPTPVHMGLGQPQHTDEIAAQKAIADAKLKADAKAKTDAETAGLPEAV
jgi:hypothetical protein